MTLRTSISLFLTFSFFGFQAQTNSSNFEIINQEYLEESCTIPNYIEFSNQASPQWSNFSQALNPYLKSKPELGFRLIRSERDQLGYVHFRYIQTYKGVDIELAEWLVHSKDGFVKSMNGKIIDDYPAEQSAQINESQALDYAMADIGAKSYKWQIAEEENGLKRELKDANASYFPQAKLVYINPELNYEASLFRLAYRFNIYAHEPLSRTEIYVDAVNGDILFRNNLIHTVNTQGTAITAYSGTQTINVDSLSSNSFRLRQTEYGNGINTYDLNQTNNYGNATDFFDSDNLWNNVNAQLDQYATDAHWGAERTYDYFFSVHGRNSINNSGFALNSYVHSSNPANGSAFYTNAFWDGQRMTYGDGNGGSVTPLTSLDIAGHEIAHGLTTFSANLIYASESGALNESFSDIFGAAIEFYARPNNANWTIGEDIGIIIRSMSNPRAYGDPDTRLGPSWMNVVGCTPNNTNDNCGVHINSGVQNKWFYLLTAGGTGTNGIGNSYSVRGTGIDTAAAVAYRNLTVYLTRFSDYDDARFFAIQSAVDLYGSCSPQVASVTDAWHAVGVGPAYLPYTLSDFEALDTLNCKAPFTVNFVNNSINGVSYVWDFGDGGTSIARSPSHTYNSIGNYSVKLVVDGQACGVDSLSRSNYISIDTTSLCEVILNTGSNATQTACIGKLFDSGGSQLNYSSNENGTITISPAGAASVQLSFISFDVEAGSSGSNCNYDYLEIFDGASINAPSLGRFCNNNLPPATISSSLGVVTLQFSSDQAVENAGFEIDWICSYPTTAPTADFTLNSTNNCSGEISFFDISNNAPNTWNWDFGDGFTSTLRNPTHTYNNSGSYTVQLISSNSFGSDSISKTNIVTINRPVAPTTQGDTSCLNQPAVLSASGSGDLKWYANQRGGTALYTGNNFNLGPISNDTSFWVEDFIEAPLQTVGPLNNTIGTGNNFNNNQYLVFDVFNTLSLERVTVFSGQGTTRTIELRDASGNVLQSKNIYIPSGYQFVNIGFEIPPGLNYQLGLSASSTIELYRNNSGTSYPYAIPGLVSIKRSSASSNPTGFYYFFYDWKVKELDCISPRVNVSAKLDTTCTITGLNEAERFEAGLSLFPNPASNLINLSIQNPAEMIQVQLLDYTGKLIFLKSYSTDGQSSFNEELNLEAFSNGLYYLKIQSGNNQLAKAIVIAK